MSSDDEAKAEAIIKAWFWQMAEGHNYRWSKAVKSMTLFYESAPMWPDIAQLVVEYLRTREGVTDFVIGHKKWHFDSPGWNAKDAYYVTAPGEKWNGTESTKVRIYWTLVQAGDGTADGPYVVENGCKYKVSHEYYWDVAAQPTLPQSTSGVQYSIQGFTRDKETGLFTYIVEKRETVQQDIALYAAQKTIFEEVSEAQYLGVKQELVAATGLAASAANGVLVERTLSKNPDCTTDVRNRRIEEKKALDARTVAHKTLRGVSSAATDRNLTPGEVAAKTAAPIDFGETRTVEKTPGDKRNLTVERFTPTPDIVLAKSCEKTSAVETDTTVTVVAAENIASPHPQTPETNKKKQVSWRKNEDGKTADRTEVVETHQEQRASGGGSQGTAATTTTERRQDAPAEAPVGAAAVNKVVEVENTPNGMGGFNSVKRTTTYHEKTAVATSNFATETAVTTTKTHTQGAATAARGTASAHPNGVGSTTTQVTEYTPKPVDSGWITWESVEDSPTHTYRYECGLRVFKNLVAVPRPSHGKRLSISANINRYGLYDGTMSYSRLKSWALKTGAGSGEAYGGIQHGSVRYEYVSDYTITHSADGTIESVTPIMATATISTVHYYGRGNDGSEAAAAANSFALPGLHLHGRTYITGGTAGIVQNMAAANAKLQAALAKIKAQHT